MRTRMLWPHVQQQFLFPLGTGHIGFSTKDIFLRVGDFALDDINRSLIESRNEVELASPATPFGRKVLSQRVTLVIILRHQNAPEIGMTGKMNTHHVVHFSFQKVGALPDSSDRRNRGIILGNTRLETKTLLKGK